MDKLLLRATLAIALAASIPLAALAEKSKDAECACQAAANPSLSVPPKGHKHPLLRGLGKEVSARASDFGKDMVLAFSARDIDPYEEKPPKNGPYVSGEVTFIDGSNALIYKFPDGSMRISGSFEDGTYACPTGQGTFNVFYPNGATGLMTVLPGGSYRIQRSDKTVTTIAKGAGGTFQINNDKFGYMGQLTPDETGLNLDFATPPLQGSSL